MNEAQLTQLLKMELDKLSSEMVQSYNVGSAFKPLVYDAPAFVEFRVSKGKIVISEFNSNANMLLQEVSALREIESIRQQQINDLTRENSNLSKILERIQEEQQQKVERKKREQQLEKELEEADVDETSDHETQTQKRKTKKRLEEES